ncbi:DUF6221 family protein [Micromonospora sp. NPDC005174]|uniref:DUF6221 family protein n=1 Tax=Micromonospora sp. NPDC005174 TaxID=3157018 RepID=UPI0033B4D1E0
MTDDRIAWLTAQIDDDEQLAHDAGGRNGPHGHWTRDGSISCVVDADNKLIVYGEGEPTSDQADHIARHDPARVLRRIERDRRTLELHDRDHECSVFDGPDGEVFNCAWLLKGDTCSTVRLMFDEYADRPGYRPEWGTL